MTFAPPPPARQHSASHCLSWGSHWTSQVTVCQGSQCYDAKQHQGEWVHCISINFPLYNSYLYKHYNGTLTVWYDPHTHTHYITYRSTRLPCTMPATGAVWSWWPLSSAGTPHASTWMHRTVIKTLLCTLPVAVDTRPSSSYSCPEGQLKEPRTRYFSTTFQN